MSTPRISLITITRNNARGLERTMQSVAAQSVAPFRHIVVDGDSTDLTDSVLARYNCTVVKAEPRGVYNAINCGLHMATGDIVGLLHAGDVFAADNILEKVSRAFETDPALGFIFGDIHYTGSRGGIRRYYSACNFTPERMPQGSCPPHPSLYVRRQVLERIGPYSEDYIICGDFDMFVRLFNSSEKWRYLPIDMVAMAPGGLSSRLYHRLFTNNRERLQVLRRHGIKSGYGRLARHYIDVFKGYLRRGKTHPITPPKI